MAKTVFRQVAVIALGVALALPTQTSVSVSLPAGVSQFPASVTKANKTPSKTSPVLPSPYVERMDKLEAATSVRKRDRKVRSFTADVNAEPRNARVQSPRPAPTASRKRAVWYGTDCYESTYYQAADYCWEDDPYDAGDSADAEIVWADTYVSWNDQSYVYTDIVPWGTITDNNWHKDPENALEVYYDTDSDGLPDIALLPPDATIKKNKSAGMRIAYFVESQDEWYYQAGSAGDSANCYASIRRFAKANHWAFSKKISWWQVSADWTCLFGHNADSIGWQVGMEDYWGTDYAPDDFMADFDYADALNYPVVTEITPRLGYDRAGGESATIYGLNLNSVTEIWERYETLYFDEVNDSELTFQTLGGVGCTEIDIFNEDWYVWYNNAICYR